jgi:drug/metabolite transporter (DMT)-like permease
VRDVCEAGGSPDTAGRPHAGAVPPKPPCWAAPCWFCPELTGHATPIDLAGIALAACAGLSYAAYSLIGGKLITCGHPSDSVLGVMFGAAGVLVLPLVLSTSTHRTLSDLDDVDAGAAQHVEVLGV